MSRVKLSTKRGLRTGELEKVQALSVSSSVSKTPLEERVSLSIKMRIVRKLPREGTVWTPMIFNWNLVLLGRRKEGTRKTLLGCRI